MTSLGLLPAQQEMIKSKALYTCFVGGYGSGKSQSLVSNAIRDAAENPSSKVGIFAPTYDLLRLILIPRLQETLDYLGIDYVYNKTESTFHCQGIADFICRSLDNPQRIVGFEVVSSHIDELDTLPEDKAKDAWQKVMARTRAVSNDGKNKVFAYTTPEGLGFCYKQWAKNTDKNYRIVRAKTRDNPFLPKGYVENLEASYPAALIKAYLDGEFCNLTEGLVYYNYDRKLNEAIAKFHQSNLPIRVGMDFNVGKMCAVAGIYHNGYIYVLDELVNVYDTPQMITRIKNRWGNNCIIYPDASGDSRSTATSKTDIALLKEHFKVKAPRKNPEVRDRVNTIIGAFCNAKKERRLKVDLNCVNLVEALENQSYNQKTGQPDKSKGFDHINDALGYLVWGLLGEKSGVRSSGVRFY